MGFFRKLFASDPKSANDYTECAKTYLDQGDYNRAIADCTKAIHLDAQNVLAYLGRGIAHDLLGRPDNAIAEFTQAIRLDPNDPIAFSNRGNTYYSTGNYAQAIADYTEAIRLDSANPVRYEKRALAYRAAGDPVKAADDEQKAEELAGTGYVSQDPLHYFHRAQTYLDQDEFDKCITDLTEALRLQPAVAGPVYALRGQAYSRKGDYERAIADYTEAIRLDPKNAACHRHRGLASAEKGEYDRAIADYSQAVRLDPKDGQAWYLRGLSWGFKGNHDQEIAGFDEALRLDPNRADVHLARGLAWDDKGDCTKALADFTEAIRLDPKFVLAYQMRGQFYSRNKDHARAIPDFTQVIALDQEPALASSTYSCRGSAHSQLGAYERAVADFTEAIRIDPRNSANYTARALAYRALGDEANAARDERTAEVEYDQPSAPCHTRIAKEPSKSLRQAPEVSKADTPESQSFRIERHGDIAVIIPSQNLVQMQENLFQQAAQMVLARLAADPPTGLVVDLTYVDYVGSLFLSFLLRCDQLAKNHGSKVVLAGVSERVRELMHLIESSLRDYIESPWVLYNTRAEALEMLGDG